MLVKNITDERSSFINELMYAESPHSKTDYFEIDEKVTFVRTYDLTNIKLPFYFSFSQKNKLPVSDEMIREIFNSDLVHHQLISQYNIQESISENNVTHIFPTSKRNKELN